jgi:transposase-like protein
MEKRGGGKRRTFSTEYKTEAVRLVGDRDKSVAVIALELGFRWDRVAALGASKRRLTKDVVLAAR